MKKLISIIILAVVGTKAIAKPHCQNFNNYDDRVTITFTDDKVGKRYDVTDVVFIPSFFGGKLSATHCCSYLSPRHSLLKSQSNAEGKRQEGEIRRVPVGKLFCNISVKVKLAPNRGVRKS